MMEGCLERPKTSAPSRKTRVATYWFAPLMRLTTAMTEVTPITTPISVSTLRSLCAHKLDVAIDTASVKCMVDARGIVTSVLTSYYTLVEPQYYARLGKGRSRHAHVWRDKKSTGGKPWSFPPLPLL